MKLTLQSLALQNFKGHTAFELNPNGSDLSIFGDNATGKTTLFDSVLWLLFGKDSLNQADFGIKTRVNGEVQHGLEHKVEGVFDLDGKPTTFTRIYKEKYTKQRGSATSEHTGHTTEYRINGVPLQAGDYEARVKAMCPGKLFQTLSDPAFFNSQLDWKARRAALFTLIPAITDRDVIDSKKELSGLPAILGDHSLEEYQKIVNASRAAINKELDAIPTRIDEASKSAGESVAAPAGTIEAARAKLTAAQEAKAAANSGGAVASKNVELSEVNAAITTLTAKINSEVDPAPAMARKKLSDAEQNVIRFGGTVRSQESKVATIKGSIERADTQMVSLRAEITAENEKAYAGDNICPSCQQCLPAAKISDAVDAFNSAKAQRIGAIQVQGKGLKATSESLAKDLEGAEAELKTARELLAEAEQIRDSIVIPVEMKVALCDVPEYQELLTRRDAILVEIQTMRTDLSGEIAKIDAEIIAAQAEIRTHETYAQAVQRSKETAERLENLHARQKEIAAEFEKLGSHLHLIELFIRAKCDLVTESIDQKFTLARWKLFDTQINGGISECCEVTVKGVPYSDLNHAARINVGLDIINALASHHQFAPPVFIDACESVTAPIATVGQQIRLIVSATDPALRVELATTNLFN